MNCLLREGMKGAQGKFGEHFKKPARLFLYFPHNDLL